MKKIIVFLIIIALGISGYFYRTQIQDFIKANILAEEKVPRTAKVPRNLPQRKKVEVFTLGIDKPEINFNKSGISSSSVKAYILPQINGRITSINVKVGDEVSKNQTLITLGDSLSTDIANLQYNSAGTGLNISEQSNELTGYSADETYFLAQISADTAEKAYENTLQNREDSADLLDLQLDNAEENLENAKDAYRKSRNAYTNLQNQINELEDEYARLAQTMSPESETLKTLQTNISEAKAQAAVVKNTRDTTKNGVEQAEIALDQLEETKDTQLNQLDFAVESAFNQYQASLIQNEAAFVGGNQQMLAGESQLLQADTQYQSAVLNIDQQSVKSPIKGVVTSISAEEGNLVSPGQILAKIENSDTLTIKTSLNEEELGFVNIGEKVRINTPDGPSAEIVSISPILDDITRKTEVEIEVEKDQSLLPGSFVKIFFPIDTDHKIFIPLNAVFIEDNKKIVKIVDENNRILFKEVVLGDIIDEYAEILKGLDGNEIIVNSQEILLENRDPVEIIPSTSNERN